MTVSFTTHRPGRPWGGGQDVPCQIAWSANVLSGGGPPPAELSLFVILDAGCPWLAASTRAAPEQDIPWHGPRSVTERWVWCDERYLLVIYHVDEHIVLPKAALLRDFLSTAPPQCRSLAATWPVVGGVPTWSPDPNTLQVTEPIPLDAGRPHVVLALLFVNSYCVWMVLGAATAMGSLTMLPTSVVWLVPQVLSQRRQDDRSGARQAPPAGRWVRVPCLSPTDSHAQPVLALDRLLRDHNVGEEERARWQSFLISCSQAEEAQRCQHQRGRQEHWVSLTVDKKPQRHQSPMPWVMVAVTNGGALMDKETKVLLP